ncbi:MAG: zinc-ribbon domain-containing protein [Candidatus Accumulibacter sp.]|nr:zinc-ribbon domain-containing protein [Accumulibacter sp.]
MAFCGNCGAQVQDGVKFCPSCGQESAAKTQPQAQHPAPGDTPPVVSGAPTQADINDAEANKGMAVIAYILFFIPLLTGAHKTSAFVKYHTNQGTVLFIAAVAWGIAENIVLAVLRAIFWNGYTWGIYGILSTVLSILWLVPTILCVVGILNAVNGRTKPLPVIGDKFTIIK